MLRSILHLHTIPNNSSSINILIEIRTRQQNKNKKRKKASGKVIFFLHYTPFSLTAYNTYGQCGYG